MLVKCLECGNDVSDAAVACPKCGYPLHQRARQPASSKPNLPSGSPQGPPKSFSARVPLRQKRTFQYVVFFIGIAMALEVLNYLVAPHPSPGVTGGKAGSAVAEDASCHSSGDVFKLHGKVVEDPVLVFPDLLLDEPLCIYRNSKPTAMKRIQLTGLPTLPRVGTTADLEGKLEIDEINDPSLHLSGENITFEVTNVLNGAPETDLIAPIEERAAIYDRSSKGLKAINASVLLVRNAGYTCTSVSAAIPWTFRSGFRLTCNQSQYVYDIEDKGGNWVVTVE